MIPIQDNFLEKEDFLKLQNIFLKSNFPWYYNNGISAQDNNETSASTDNNPSDPYFQFTHLFFGSNKVNSDFYPLMKVFIDKLNIKALVRIKANCCIRTKEHEKHGFHNDSNNNITALFYCNTNNGYTEFKNGEIIQSVANRMVVFDSNLQHQSVSCTDQKTRVVINFNYYTDD